MADKLKSCMACKNYLPIDTAQSLWIHCCIQGKYEILDIKKDCIDCEYAKAWNVDYKETNMMENIAVQRYNEEDF